MFQTTAWRKDLRLALLTTSFALLLAQIALAGPPAQVTISNNTLPGHQTIHEIRREITRSVKRDKFIERLVFEQKTTLVQCNVSLPQQGKILVYQLVVDEPAKVKGLYHDKAKISPTPPAERFNLSKGSTRLTSERKNAREAPLELPPGDPAQSIVIRNVLDAAYWQPKKIEAGHKWQRQITGDLFEGTQTLQFLDMTDVAGQAVARLALKVEGKFKGPLERDFRFGMTEGVIHWARLERTIAKIEGIARYHRVHHGVTEEYEIKIEENLRNITQLSEPQQDKVKEQMSAFAAAIDAANQGNMKDARDYCRDFRNSWPDSIFTPAIVDLEHRAAPDAPSQDRMSRAQLLAAIKGSVVSFEAARSSHDSDVMDLTLTTMTQIARDYSAILAKLTRDKDEMIRANAAFALAFSARPEDQNAVQKCAVDKSTKVKVLALTGLAAAENHAVSAELLMGLLEDKEAGVRRRTLQAVAACIPRENFGVAKLVEKIDRLMVYDKNDGVRSDAVAAIVSIGSPADIPQLEEALKHELNTGIREQIHQGIEKLRERR